jgi:p-hydroxybenzoate 3-monooxygenase
VFETIQASAGRQDILVNSSGLAEHASLEETTEKHVDRAFGLNVRAMVFTVQHPVVIIGAGVAGLTLATFLYGSGVNCVVLERGDRAYLQTVRQRAGVVDARNVQMFERRGLAEKLLAGPVAQTIDYRTDGLSRIFEITGDHASEGRFCTQQMLVNNLLRVLIDEMGGDVRFEVGEVTIYNEEATQPQVRYTDSNGAHELTCDYIAGCDADRGVSSAH